VLIKKLAMVTLAVLTVSAIACTRVLPVKLELPNKPSYYHDVSSGVIAIENRGGSIMHFTVTRESMKKLAKNTAMCREYNTTLRKIILTTH